MEIALNNVELMRPPYPVMISEQLSSYLNVDDGDYIPLGAGELLGPIKVDASERITGSRLIADMSLLRTLNRSPLDLIWSLVLKCQRIN